MTVLGSFARSVADRLRGPCTEDEYGSLIPPCPVLRCLECVRQSHRETMGKVSETLTDAVVPHEGVFEGLAGALPRERERADEFIHLFGQNRWQSRRRRTVDVIESSDAEEAEEEK